MAGNGRAVLFHRMMSGETGGAVTAMGVQGGWGHELYKLGIQELALFV